jgi:hypothetical protein
MPSRASSPGAVGAEPRLDAVARHQDPLLRHAQMLRDVAGRRVRAREDDGGAPCERAGQRAEVRADRSREQLRRAQHEHVVHRHDHRDAKPGLRGHGVAGVVDQIQLRPARRGGHRKRIPEPLHRRLQRYPRRQRARHAPPRPQVVQLDVVAAPQRAPQCARVAVLARPVEDEGGGVEPDPHLGGGRGLPGEPQALFDLRRRRPPEQLARPAGVEHRAIDLAEPRGLEVDLG